MVATIGPLVQVARKQWLRSVALYGVASVCAGAAVGATAGGLGAATGVADAIDPAYLAVAAVGAGIIDLRILGLGTPVVAGSVPQEWWSRLGPSRAALLYGWVLGLGFTTAVPFAAFYVLGLGAVSAGPALGALIGATYGFFRAAAIPIASAAVLRGQDMGSLSDWPYRRRTVARGICAGALGIVGVSALWL